MERNEENTTHINESRSYSLILCFELESAQAFKQWVTKEVLPSIRKMGIYSHDDLNHKHNDSLTLNIENELDLHIKAVSFLKKRYPNSIRGRSKKHHNDEDKRLAYNRQIKECMLRNPYLL